MSEAHPLGTPAPSPAGIAPDMPSPLSMPFGAALTWRGRACWTVFAVVVDVLFAINIFAGASVLVGALCAVSGFMLYIFGGWDDVYPLVLAFMLLSICLGWTLVRRGSELAQVVFLGLELLLWSLIVWFVWGMSKPGVSIFFGG